MERIEFKSSALTRVITGCVFSPLHLLAFCLVGTGLFPAVSLAADAELVTKLLADRCVLCHQGASAPRNLRLETLEDLLAGGDNGPVVIAGNPDESEIMRRVRGMTLPRMPMTGPPWLTGEEEDILSEWIAAGANSEFAAAGSGSAANEGTSQRRQADDSGLLTYLDVAPILAQRCAKCHTENGLMGAAPEGYILTSHADTLDFSDRARVIPGNPQGSELIRRVRGDSKPRMPHDGPPYLEQADIDLLEKWIQQGAADSQGNPAPIPVGAKVRFRGILTAPDRIDDAWFRLTSKTRVDKSPRVGRRAELRARVESDGSLTATRLRRR